MSGAGAHARRPGSGARGVQGAGTLDRLAVALEALVALALMLSSMTGLIGLALALLFEDHAAEFWHVMPSIWQEFFASSKIKLALCIIMQFGQMGMSATPFSSLWS